MIYSKKVVKLCTVAFVHWHYCCSQILIS